MTFLFDTGSSLLWIPETACSSDQCPGGRYNAAGSGTFRGTSDEEFIQYGKGSVKGYLVYDQVSLNSNGDVGTVDDFLFVSIFEAFDIEGLASDGLLGLTPLPLSENQPHTFVN